MSHKTLSRLCCLFSRAPTQNRFRKFILNKKFHKKLFTSPVKPLLNVFVSHPSPHALPLLLLACSCVPAHNHFSKSVLNQNRFHGKHYFHFSHSSLIYDSPPCVSHPPHLFAFSFPHVSLSSFILITFINLESILSLLLFASSASLHSVSVFFSFLFLTSYFENKNVYVLLTPYSLHSFFLFILYLRLLHFLFLLLSPQ